MVVVRADNARALPFVTMGVMKVEGTLCRKCTQGIYLIHRSFSHFLKDKNKHVTVNVLIMFYRESIGKK